MRDQSERLMRLLRGGTCDRPPLFEPWFAMGGFLRRRYGRGGIDGYLAMSADLGHAAVPLSGPDTSNFWAAEVERIESTGVWYGGGALREPEQLRARPEPDYDAQVEPMLRQRRMCADAGVACWAVLGWCFDRIAASMGLERFALEVYDRPEFVREAFEWVERRNQRAVARILAKVKPDFVLYNGDCAYKTGPMISPAMMRDLTFECSKKTVDMVRDLGLPFAFHTDGKLDDVIPLLLDLGICAVHGCEKQANDLAFLVDRFGGDIALCGNMDVVFLKEATPPQIVEATREMIAVGNRKGRFIAGCNTSPQDYIPEENYVAMCRAIAE